MSRLKNISLRGMAIFIALVCVWLAITVNTARRQAKSVARIEAAGGHVQYDYEVKFVDSQVSPDGSGLQLGILTRLDPQSSWPKWLVDIAGRDFFHQVKTAHVGSDQSEADTHEIVDSLPGLKELELHGHAATQDAVEAASRLRRLEMLVVDSQVTCLGEDSLASLAAARQLRVLVIYDVSLSDRDLESLRQLPNLECVSCVGCRYNGQPIEPVMVSSRDKIEAFLQNPLSP